MAYSAYHRDYMRTWTRQRKQLGLCCECNEPASGSRCASHELIHREQARRNRQQPEEKKKRCAREAVRRAVQSGRLVKPEVCPVCQGSKERIQAHHSDYTRYLEIEWRCSICHGKMHRKAA